MHSALCGSKRQHYGAIVNQRPPTWTSAAARATTQTIEAGTSAGLEEHCTRLASRHGVLASVVRSMPALGTDQSRGADLGSIRHPSKAAKARLGHGHRMPRAGPDLAAQVLGESGREGSVVAEGRVTRPPASLIRWTATKSFACFELLRMQESTTCYRGVQK